jgi:hypothetical protein
MLFPVKEATMSSDEQRDNVPLNHVLSPDSEARLDIDRRARAYRRQFGDPVENLVGLLGQFVQDEDTWQDIVDEPYG